MSSPPSQFDPRTGRLREPRRLFDWGDLRVVGVAALVIVTVLGIAALLGLALRVFLVTSGLR